MDQVKFFKGCLPQILLGPFLNTLSQMSSHYYKDSNLPQGMSQKVANGKTYNIGHFQSSMSPALYLKPVHLILTKSIDKIVHQDIITALDEMKFADFNYNIVTGPVSLFQKENMCIFNTYNSNSFEIQFLILKLSRFFLLIYLFI